MEPLTTIIAGCAAAGSAGALALGLYNFWWTQLRDRRALYLVRIDKDEAPGPINFALVNAGSRDILITGVFAYLEGKEHGQRFRPGGVVEHGESIVAAGKASEYRLKFDQPIPPDVARQGRRIDDPGRDLYTYPVGVEVSWLHMDGTAFVAFVLHTIITFDATGRICGGSPFSRPTEKCELFAKSI